MRILVDENIPRMTVKRLRDLGHDVRDTSSSWLNMVERFFRDITQNQIRRSVFRSVPELISSIETYVDQHNRDPKPFIWTAKASDNLSDALHY